MLNRLRQQSNLEQDTIVGTVYYPHNKSTYPTYKVDFNVGGLYQNVYDYYIPKAKLDETLVAKRKRIKRVRHWERQVPPINDVLMSKVSYVSPKGRTFVTYAAKFAGYHVNAYGANMGMYHLQQPALTSAYKPPSTLAFTSVDPKVASYLLQRAYSKMSTAQYDFGVTIGEIAETAAFLAKPLQGIVRLSAKAFKGISNVYVDGTKVAVRVAKGVSHKQLMRIYRTTKAHPFDSSLRIVDESANHWLAYKFGVLPMIDDIDKAQLFSDKNVERLLGLRLSRAGGPKTDVTSLVSGVNYRYGDFRYNGSLLRRIIDQHSCGLYWRDKVDAPLLNFVENLGFAPWQLPSLAWELIPLSFVVDRFIDIKSFVRGNIGSLSKQTLGHWCTHKITTVYASNVTNVRYGGDSDAFTLKVSKELTGTALSEQMARVAYISRPNFPVINPYWQQQLIADATNLSLIWGRLRTHVGKLL